MAGEVPGEWSSRFEATYHVIEPDAQIVYSYEMFHDEVRLSVSVTTIELEPIDGGAATRLVFTEQGAYFGDGEAANSEPRGRDDRDAEAARGVAVIADAPSREERG